jgi:hypothetical protein
MKRFAAAFAAATLCPAGVAAQAPQPSEATSSEASLAGGTAINAELNSSIDSKNAKPGEQITAHITEAVKSTDGRAILPKGTKLIGHVTKASARSNGQSEAMLAIQFDKAVLKDKQEVPLNNVVIQAVSAPAQRSAAYGSDLDRATATGAPNSPGNNPSMSGSRGARPEGTPQTYPSASANGGNTDGTPGDSGSAGPLPANARGVYEFEGLRMNANANGEGTVLTSSTKNVHLDGGTRLLLMVQPQTASAVAPSGR